MPKEILLTNSDAKAIIDDEDYMYVAFYSWRLNKGYARMTIKPYVYLHQIIALRIELKGEIDHEDRNKLNNQRNNLRVATNTQNQVNREKKDGTSSNYKGVSWHKRDETWYAYISVNNKMQYLGKFELEEDAAKAYNEAALKYHGEFALLNEVAFNA